MPILETTRLRLRKLKPEDASLLHKILSDTETMQYYPSPYDMSGVTDWIGRSLSSYEKHGFGLWAVILKETNEFIGQCGISIQDINGDLVPEIGYHINKNHWNQGYATEAAKGCLKYGFETLKLNTIFIHTYVKNLPSQRIAEKLGMEKTMEYGKFLERHNVTWQHLVYLIDKD